MKKLISILFVILSIFILSFATINVYADNSDFEYLIDGDVCEVYEYTGNETEVEIPSDNDGIAIKRIGNSCFQGNKTIEKVIIPNSIEEIGNYSFDSCKNLKSIEFCGSVISIGSYSFDGCSSLEVVKLPDGLETISDHAFAGDKSLKAVYIPSTVTEIREDAFYNCGDIVFYCDVESSTYSLLKSTLEKSGYETINISSADEFKSVENEYIAKETTEITETESETTTTTVVTTTVTTLNTTRLTTTTTKVENVNLGDVNLDGKVNANDAVVVLKKYANELAKTNYDLLCNEKAADLNFDGKINSNDAVIILKYYANKLAGYKGTVADYIK